MGRGRNKAGAGAVEATRYDVFGNPIGERPTTPPATDPIVASLGAKALRQMERNQPENLVYVMDEATKEGITELPVTTPDGRTFILRRGERGVVFDMSPEDQALVDDFNRQFGKNPKTTLSANGNVYYRTAYHPAAYYLAQAQREFMSEPTRENEDRMRKMQNQFDSIRSQLAPGVVALFDQRYKEAGGAVPLPRSIVLARAATEKPRSFITGSTDLWDLDGVRVAPAKIKRALSALAEYDSGMVRAKQRIAEFTRINPDSVDAEALKYEIQRLLRAATRLQTKVDKAVQRNPRLGSVITADDKQRRNIRETQFEPTIGYIDVA